MIGFALGLGVGLLAAAPVLRTLYRELGAARVANESFVSELTDAWAQIDRLRRFVGQAPLPIPARED